MEALKPLLHSFYLTSLSTSDRANIHNRLLQALQDPSCLAHAEAHLASVASTSTPPDAFLLHYALHATETAARTTFPSIPPDRRASLLSTLLTFQISSHERNLSAAATYFTVPPHILNKAADATVQLGLREWIANSTHAFPRTVLALTDQNGHTPASAPRILTGMALVTGILDAATDPSRKDLRAVHRATLLRLLRSVSDAFVAALEVAARISGPAFPRSVSLSAVRAVPLLVRVEPAVGKGAVEMLERCSTGRYDHLGAETLGILAELYSEGKARMQDDWPATLARTTALLDPIAMGEAVLGESDEACLLRHRVVTYAEAVMRRVIALGARGSALERVLNGLMGVTLKWATESPAQMVHALDTWLSVFEALEDAEADSDMLLERAYKAVCEFCARCCMHATNGKVLASLEVYEEESPRSTMNGRDVPDSVSLFEWDESAELMAVVASDPISMSTMLFMSSTGAEDDFYFGDGEHDGILCSRAAYIGKCVETLLACTRMSSKQVGGAAADFVITVLREKGQTIVNSLSPSMEDVRDLSTAAYVAYCIVPLFPADSPKMQALLEVLCELVKVRLWQKDTSLGTMLLRTVASLTSVFSCASPQFVQSVGAMLKAASAEVITSSVYPEKLASAATLLVLSLDSYYRAALFSSGPPVDVEVLSRTSYPSVASLGVAAMTRWAVVPARDAKTSLPLKWSTEEWSSRQTALQKQYKLLFDPFVRVCALGDKIADIEALRTLTRGAGLLKAMVLSVYSVQGNTTDALWQSIGNSMSLECLKALAALQHELRREKSSLDHDAKRMICGVMGCVVGTIGSLLRVCQRQLVGEAARLASETINLVLDSARAQGSLRLARAALRLIREQLSRDSATLLQPGITLSAQWLEQGADQEVAVASVGVLSEGLKRHWVSFWPGDAVGAAAGAGEAPEDARRLYFVALQGILQALRAADLATCREALLALQGLDAARRLYSRSKAFHDTGAADAVVMECMCVLGAGGDAARESLTDEAVEVVWGIAKVDMERFCSRCVPGVVRAIGGVSAEQGAELVQGLSGARERNAFVRATRAFANDFVYLRRLNSGPTL